MGSINDAGVKCKFVEDGLGATIEAMFGGMQGLIQSKTVVGEQVVSGDTVLIPLIEVSAGMAGGAFGGNGKHKDAGAMSAKMSPVAVLVLQGDRIRLINIKNQDAVTKIIDLIPEAVDRIAGHGISPEAVKKAKEIAVKLGVGTGDEEETKEEAAPAEE